MCSSLETFVEVDWNKLYLAMLGISDKKIVLKVPAGTQSGTTFRIKGQGVEKGEMTGDQLVKVTVKVPDHLSDEGKKAAEQLAELESLKY